MTRRVGFGAPNQPANLLLDGGSLWVSGSMLLRLEDGRIVQRLKHGVSRVGLARVGDELWATGGGDGGTPDGSVAIFDAETGRRRDRLVFPGRSPYGIDAGGDEVFVALFHGELLRVDPDDHTHSRIRLSHGLTQVLVGYGKVWVASPQSGKVWRVPVGDPDGAAAATDLRPLSKGACPQGLETSRRALWVADPCAKRLWLLDPRTGDVIDELGGLGKPIDVDVSGSFAWVVSYRTEDVTVVDVETLQVVGRGEALQGAIAIAARGRTAWVANHEDYSLTRLVRP